MGEIKSTLDLVLEKTMHLSLSSEEKRKLAVQEIEKRIKGMLQKYQDGALTPEELSGEYESIKNDDKPTADGILIREVVGCLDFAEVNELLLRVLAELGGFDTAGLKAVIDKFRDAYHKAAGKRSGEIKNLLADRDGISGSAVVPNLAADEQWRRQEREIRARFEDELDRVKTELTANSQRA